MQLLGLVLILINVVAVAAPVGAVVVIYRDDLTQLVVPPEIEEITDSTLTASQSFTLPQFVSSTYDVATKTVTVTFNFTNPFNLNMTINSVSADVQCNDHKFTLGHASLNNAVKLDFNETANLTVNFKWTQEAEAHFLAQHAGAKTININLINVGVDVSGITIETPQTVNIGEVPLTL